MSCFATVSPLYNVRLPSGRFIVMQDRWDRAKFADRSVEDLKSRYYSISSTLKKVGRAGSLQSLPSCASCVRSRGVWFLRGGIVSLRWRHLVCPSGVSLLGAGETFAALVKWFMSGIT